jgi:cyclophilin family peptidyl-prolyl cis-trans isomerase
MTLNSNRIRHAVALCLLLMGGCIDVANPFRPPTGDNLMVISAADQPNIRHRESVMLSVAVDGGRPPFAFRWDLNGGPATVRPRPSSGATVSAGPFEISGRYTYRVVATDSAGATGVAFVVVNVEPGVGVTLTSTQANVLEGASVELTATVVRAVEPLTFAWSLEEGPGELDLSEETDGAILTPPLSGVGDFVFRVTVTDGTGLTASDTTTVSTESALTIDAPRLVFVGEPATLAVMPDSSIDDPTFSWTVTQGLAALDDAASAEAVLTVQIGETLLVELSVGFVNEAGQSATLLREIEIVAVNSSTPRVLIETNFGDFTLELDTDAALLTVANFLAYVDDGFYDGVVFHRNACTNNPDTNECDPFVLQGGGFVREDDELVPKEPTRDPIPSEADNGRSNGELYSVAMALSGGSTNSAQTQFYINLKNNDFLDAQGFTVFGLVVEGRDVVDGIVAMETTTSPIIPGEVSLPVEDVIMTRVSRVAP